MLQVQQLASTNRLQAAWHSHVGDILRVGVQGSAATAVLSQISNKTPDDGHHGSEGHDASYKTHPHSTPLVHTLGVWQPEGAGSKTLNPKLCTGGVDGAEIAGADPQDIA